MKGQDDISVQIPQKQEDDEMNIHDNMSFNKKDGDSFTFSATGTNKANSYSERHFASRLISTLGRSGEMVITSPPLGSPIGSPRSRSRVFPYFKGVE